MVYDSLDRCMRVMLILHVIFFKAWFGTGVSYPMNKDLANSPFDSLLHAII